MATTFRSRMLRHTTTAKCSWSRQLIGLQIGTGLALWCRDSMQPDGLETTQRDVLAQALAAYVRDDDAMQRAQRLAERHGRLPQGSFAARELVTDVIGDMLTGDLKSKPEQAVAPQIEKHVQRWANHLRHAQGPPRDRGPRKSRRRARQRPQFVPLDEAPASALVVDGPQHGLDREQEGVLDATEVVARIIAYARGDDAVRQLLELHDRGLHLRRDALDAGMTDWIYRAAWKRLTEYATAALAELPGTPAAEVDAQAATDAAAATAAPAIESWNPNREPSVRAPQDSRL
jgi:hypothetical protein